MTEQCPKCHSNNISKTEDIDGVEVDYNLENGEWVEVDQNWYGSCNISYKCNECELSWT